MMAISRARQSLKLMLLAAAILLSGTVIALAVAVVPRVSLYSPPPTALIVDRNGAFLAEQSLEDGRLGFWEAGRPLPIRITACILAVEDKRFYEHNGVDVRSVVRAALSNVLRGTFQGASTIAMQVARLQKPGRRTLWNKLVETAIAFSLVKRFGRAQVLSHYLRIVPQGNQIHGCAYAARRYFDKPLSDLSWAEAALLASIPRAPGLMNLFQPDGFGQALQRASTILRLVYDQGHFDVETYGRSLNELGRSPSVIKEQRPQHSLHYILRLFGLLETAQDLSYQHPVRSSLDLQIQDHVQKLATLWVARYRDNGMGNLSAIVVEKQSGAIRAYLGSEDYFDEHASGSINYANTPRSSGSTLKPFLYALGLEEHFTPASILADLPLEVVNADGQYSHTYRNVDDEFLGPLLYRKALANSRNIPAVRVLEAVGLQRIHAFFQRLGLHDGTHPADYYGYGIVLGGLHVTLESLVEAYGILATEGKRYELNWLAERHSPSGPQLFPESSARQVALFLSDPLARLPTFPRLSSLELPFPVAIKTGTSQGYRDAWAIAYSSQYIVGVWLGHPDHDGMNQVGSNVAARFVQEMLLFLQPQQARGIDVDPFPAPRGTAAARICVLSGEVATDDCPEVSMEHFLRGTQPRRPCSVHRKYAIDKRNGAPATAETPSDQIVVQVSAVLAPHYAAWATKQGYPPPPSDVGYPPRATIRIVAPTAGSRLIVDPEIPRQFQSIPLRAEVSPVVPEIIWYVDGKEFSRAPYPYETRWPINEGPHLFQARFARANVYSNIVQISIGGS